MSGLEPLAALGLVCNIVQLVEVGLKTATLCKNAYRTGEPDPELSVYAQNLAETASSLTQSLAVSQQPLSHDDSRLLTLAQNCRDAEDEWRKKTPARFLSQQKLRKRARFGAVLQGIVSKPEIDRLEIQLQKAKESLEADLLVGVFKRLDISKVETDDLQDKLQTLLQASSTSEKKLHDLIQNQVTLINSQISDHILRAEASTKAHVTTELASQESRLKSYTDQGKNTLLSEAEVRENSRRDDEAYERLLRSFYYPDMNRRRNEIHASHGSTFKWLFEGELEGDYTESEDSQSESPSEDETDSYNQELVCSSFATWLKSAEDRYWISGRPGTGKSVLMKFIISHKQTMDSLRQWQPEVQILAHFFWKVGSAMQSSFKGFLCSLVYQLFSLDKEYARDCLQQNPDWSRKTGPGDWDKKDLQSLFQSYARHLARPFCLFIDGLDELMDDEGVGIIIEFLDSLQKSSRLIKICMSSRPEQAIRARLCRDPDLKVQDLTRLDIEQYSRATLKKETALATSSIYLEDIVRDISLKAEGVFLWAVLVTRSIARGILNGDSEADIWKRLQKTPKKLHELYLDMWTRLGEDSDLYQCSTALIFKIVLFVWQSSQSSSQKSKNGITIVLAPSMPAISTWELMLASSDDLWSTPVNHCDKLSATDLEQRCNELFTRLPFRTADLFEVVQTSEYERPDERQWAHKSHFPVLRYNKLKVEAIHRTVFDFLIETEDGKKIMEHHKASQEELFIRTFRSCLLRDSLWPEVSFYATLYEKEPNEAGHSWHLAGNRLNIHLQALSLHADSIRGSILVEMLDLVWASFVQITKNFPSPPHRLVSIGVPRCRLEYLLRIAPQGFDAYIRDDLIEWENTRQFDALHQVLLACLGSGDGHCTDFEWAGRQRLIERILWIVVSADRFYILLPRGLHLSNDSLVKASMACLLISAVQNSRFYKSRDHHIFLRDAHRTNAILRMIRDFRNSLCLGDHMLVTLYREEDLAGPQDLISWGTPPTS
ncbi:hypothetical protein RAB80_008939 [Fusarium oxysporum f. sp. vasinfectum]|nr:hypothetical protein RAB80_008939 [Fusarium oxysporum f. sp. vasinfectum]